MKREGTSLGIYNSLGVKTREQDGRKHYMLCGDCDGFLGEGEAYVRTTMHGSDGERRALGITADEDWLHGLSANLVERFLIGIAVKSHLAPGAPFHRITFAKSLFDQLRRYLLHGCADAKLYVIAMRFYSEVVPGVDPRAMMFANWQPNGSPQIFSTTVAGWEWLLFIDDGCSFQETPFWGSHLTRDGSIRIPRGDITLSRNYKIFLMR